MPKFLNKTADGSCYKCTVRLLEDGKILDCEFQTNNKGQHLLDYVCEHLNLVEKDYFGLRFVDAEQQRHWLDPAKSILKQVKDVEPLLFSFRLKFYPQYPFQLKEQITRYQVYLQLRRDMLHGRLYCSDSDAALLGAYVLQVELGDYNPDEHIGNYGSECKIFLKDTLNVEERMMEIHQTELRGQSLEETEANFLRKASTLDTYGVDPHPVKDQKGVQSLLGVNYAGIIIFQNNRKSSFYKWSEVQKINYEGKMFIVHLTHVEDSRTKKKETVGFKCPSSNACRHLWRCAIEQMLFFSYTSPAEVPRKYSGGGFFTGSKFKYAGRIEREVIAEMAQLSREEPRIQRVGSLRRKASSVPATPSTPVVNDLPDYRTSPRLNFNSVENRSPLGGEAAVQYNADGSTLLEPVVEDSEVTSNKFGKKRAEDLDTALPVQNAHNVDCVDVGNFKGSFSESTLYQNREQMDHSSSESHATGGSASLRSSRNPTPVPKGSVHFSSEVSGDAGAADNRYYRSNYTPYEGADTSVCSRACSFVRACLPSVVLTMTSLLVVMVVVFETDVEFFALLRRAPEMVLIRRQYYEPVKEHIQTVIGELYKKLHR